MTPSTITRSVRAGHDLRAITLATAPAMHLRPGQYVTVQVADAPTAFFALASAPGQPAELLIKPTGAAGSLLASAPVGTPVSISAAAGGFDLNAVAGRPLAVLVNGTGISAVRALISAEVRGGLPRPVHLLYGVLAPRHRAYLWDLERWANAGVQVHTVVDPTGAKEWAGASGWVQDHATDLGLVRSDVGVVLAGVPAMLSAATARWTQAGCPASRILTNF